MNPSINDILGVTIAAALIEKESMLPKVENDADREAWDKIYAEIEASEKPPHILIGRNIHKKSKRKSKWQK